MIDDIKAIRDALAAGPTPGPWHAVNRGAYWHEDEGDVRTDGHADVVGAEFVVPIGNAETTRGQVWFRDAAYIAACHPERIARLLDALEHAQKDAARYRAIRLDHEGELFPDIALYAGRALDGYIDAAMATQATPPPVHPAAPAAQRTPADPAQP